MPLRSFPPPPPPSTARPRAFGGTPRTVTVEVEADLVELPPALLEPEPDTEPVRIPASMRRRWSRARPVVALLLVRAGRLLVAWGDAFGHAVPRSRPAGGRWLAARRACWAIWQPARRVTARVRRLWPGWPTTSGRLGVLVAVALVLGGALMLPFALASRRARPAVALEPVPSPANAPAAASTGQADAPELPRAAEEARPSRAQLARQMALESFESGRPLDGIGYFRMALRAQSLAAEDDVLVLHTIETLSHPRAADAAERLLRALGQAAGPLLKEAAQGHPDPLVRSRARRAVSSSLVKGSP
jgi:hypothetical protein